MEKLVGVEIPAELYRMVSLTESERPSFAIHVTDPKHKPGGNYEALKLSSFGISYSREGMIQSVEIITHRDGQEGAQYFHWYPEGVEPEPDRMAILSMQVLLSYPRFAIEEGRYREFLRKLPNISPEFVENQLYKNSLLPKTVVRKSKTSRDFI